VKFNAEAAAMDGLLPEGQYEAVVKRAEEKVSKSGNPMIELIVTCFTVTGAKVDVFDYLLSTDDWAWKVRHFCESAGLEWAGGSLNDHQCVDRNVRVNLSIKKQAGYPDKNSVADYLPRPTFAVNAVNRAPEDDDIPF
jgi:hypothetical protein